MPTYMIEREIPGASKLSASELRDISAKSNEVVANLGEPYTWMTSYVAGDKIFCIHEAQNPEAIRCHAERGGFPVTSITEIAATIGPATGV